MTGPKATPEQQDILDAAATGQTVAISAGAWDRQDLDAAHDRRPIVRRRMLYVAYNKAIQQEADRSFPANVTCKTAHSLAYRSFGAPMRDRLNGLRRTGAQNASALGISRAVGLDADHIFEPDYTRRPARAIRIQAWPARLR